MCYTQESHTGDIPGSDMSDRAYRRRTLTMNRTTSFAVRRVARRDEDSLKYDHRSWRNEYVLEEADLLEDKRALLGKLSRVLLEEKLGLSMNRVTGDVVLPLRMFLALRVGFWSLFEFWLSLSIEKTYVTVTLQIHPFRASSPAISSQSNQRWWTSDAEM
jgi:hypothetical protein